MIETVGPYHRMRSMDERKIFSYSSYSEVKMERSSSHMWAESTPSDVDPFGV
ncbi:hypothetical protein C8Q75DRAFT_772962, partial [Abortiporus biennis]